MIKISVNKKKQPLMMYDPVDMLLNSCPEGQVFQQYYNDIPQKDFYITCGLNELSVIYLWFNHETESYSLSTSDRKSLLGLAPSVKVVPINAEVLIVLETK